PSPNVLILYDNSFSMEGQMGWIFRGGNDPLSRSNIARSAIRSILDRYHTKFNWGIETFQMKPLTGNDLYGIYPFYEGDNSNMVFTNDCTNGISASNGNLRCIPNPEPNG